jgi:hypothetical protein
MNRFETALDFFAQKRKETKHPENPKIIEKTPKTLKKSKKYKK